MLDSAAGAKDVECLWAKREAQIRGVIESTAGMYGDLQGIAGKTLQEIDGLSITGLLVDGSAASETAEQLIYNSRDAGHG